MNEKTILLHLSLFMLLILISCTGQHQSAPPQNIKSQIKSERNSNIPNIPILNKPSNNTAPNSITRNIIEDTKGNIWFASFEGIIKYDGQSFTNITSEVSLSRFFSILEDKKGNFWFTSIGSGIYYFDGETFQNFTTKEGLVHDKVTNIYEDTQGNIWFGTLGGASRYDGQGFQNFTTEQGLPDNDVNSIVQDNTGKFWLGTRGAACTYDGKEFTIITTHQAKDFHNVRHIIKDRKGHIWWGGHDGLWSYDGKVFSNFTQDFVGYVYEDKNGHIWTSSQSSKSAGWALSRYDSTSLNNTKVSAAEAKTGEGMFFGILEDSDGNIWSGTLNGVYRYDGHTFYDFK